GLGGESAAPLGVRGEAIAQLQMVGRLVVLGQGPPFGRVGDAHQYRLYCSASSRKRSSISSVTVGRAASMAAMKSSVVARWLTLSKCSRSKAMWAALRAVNSMSAGVKRLLAATRASMSTLSSVISPTKRAEIAPRAA